MLRAEFADAPIEVYRGEVVLVAHFKSPVTTAKLALRYQPCDESSCLPAATIEFEIPAP